MKKPLAIAFALSLLIFSSPSDINGSTESTGQHLISLAYDPGPGPRGIILAYDAGFHPNGAFVGNYVV
ncbi:hypothetical protein [Tumebacillus lipolyticus]|uniref:Uncharacterized protein n=1 Tax=Tumebacillus lipolyticus TaxID=1280370 RepID=A0ABW4ZVM0_9BACL